MNVQIIYEILHYDQIDVSKGIAFNKSNASKECIICHYWYFLNKGFRFQSTVCDGCHDISMIFIDINSVVILNIHGVDYFCIIVGITKSEAKNLLRDVDLSEKSESL